MVLNILPFRCTVKPIFFIFEYQFLLLCSNDIVHKVKINLLPTTLNMWLLTILDQTRLDQLCNPSLNFCHLISYMGWSDLIQSRCCWCLKQTRPIISKPGFLSNVKLLLEMPTHLFLLLSIFHGPWCDPQGSSWL